MKASEYIKKLADLVDEYGDLEVMDSYLDEPPDPEEVEGSFVLAERFS